jgi:hypothetical protein
MGHNQPKLTEKHIDQIRQLITDNPDWHRTRLSKELCVLWDWRSPVGQIKDISARDMLRTLDKKGLITLPDARFVTRAPGGIGADKIRYITHDTTPIDTKLSELTPLHIKIITSKQDSDLFKTYIHKYHYLGYERSVGESLKYFVFSNEGVLLACLMFGAAAWSCADRDYYIGWNKDQKRDSLTFLANNHRFLVNPWVHVPCLASHILGAIVKRISGDWQKKYGHPLFLLETFVDQKFRGTSYKAANWRNVGETKGLGRNNTNGEQILPIKNILLYPLSCDFKEKLCGNADASNSVWGGIYRG